MSHSVNIIPVGDLPKITDEPFASLSDRKGPFLWLIEQVNGCSLLDAIDRSKCVSMLKNTINNIDLGDKCKLSNDIASDICNNSDEYSEIYDDWRLLVRFLRSKGTPESERPSFDAFAGEHMRKNARDIAVRFFLYYSAGYLVEFK